jgi:uncharacterized protein (TIGR02757 family)
MTKNELKSFLDEKYIQYHSSEFIGSDPIQIPHQFNTKQDIEISGFLTATISWGQRVSIIKNASRLMELMDQAPYQFIMEHEDKDLKRFENFVHRTFNSDDLLVFIASLKNIYKNHDGLESLFTPGPHVSNLRESIVNFRQVFFEIEHLSRTEKHVSNPESNSACKRIHMFLRWMVRTPSAGVDFGIWKSISPALLSCPLDVHSGNVARKLGLLSRKQNDWKAVDELDQSLRKMDAKDPVKYDFALFGLGVFENF